MATNSFTVGRDVSAVVIAPNGTRLDLTGLTDFTSTPEYKMARTDPLDNPPQERFLPAGHRLKFNIDRTGPANETLISQIEQGWWATGSADAGTSNNGSVFVYINESDGSQSRMQYTGVSLKMDTSGDFKTDSPVKQTIECFASRGQRV